MTTIDVEHLDVREKLAHIDQMLADHDRKRQEITYQPITAMISGMTAGAALFAAGAAFFKIMGMCVIGALLLSTPVAAMDYTRIPEDIASKNVVELPWTYRSSHWIKLHRGETWAPAKMPISVNEKYGPPKEPWKGLCVVGLKCASD